MNHAKHVEDLQAVLEVSRELAVTDCLEHLVRSVEGAACKVLECEQATLLLYDRKLGELTRPELPSVDTGDDGHAIQAGLAGEVARSGRRIELDDPAADPRFDAGADGFCCIKTHNLAFFPLLDDRQRVVGVL